VGESIKYKKPDTYHDAGNVYDNTQGKTQEKINTVFEAARIKSMSFTATVDQWSQIHFSLSGKQILFAFSADWLLVYQALDSFRVFGPLSGEQLNSVPNGTTVSGTFFYTESN